MNKDIINTQAEKSSIKGMFMQSLFGGTAGLILAFLILCITSVFLFVNPLSYETVSIVSMTSKYICAIAAALLSCVKRNSKGYLRGLLASVLFVVLGAVFFSMFSSDGLNGNTFVYDLLICSVLGMLSGAVAVNFNSKRSK